MSERFQLVYFPHLALTGVDEIKFVGTRVWNSSRLEEEVADTRIRERVATVFTSHRLPSGGSARSRPVTDIGVISVEPPFRPLTKRELQGVEDLRAALFLACLSSSVRRHGPNSGHDVYTSENFSIVIHNFTLDKPYFAEETGTIVRMTHMGYKIGEVQFPTPSYVPRPMRFHYDEDVLAGLEILKRVDVRTYRRIIRASSVFLESYYNTPAVDGAARVLLQAAAFEVLLDLPVSSPRLVFKNSIEKLCANPGERRYRYKYEARSGRQPDTRTQKGIWADRFYTLRNHIIHGEQVSASEYRYRDVQHHVLIAALFFVVCSKRLILEAVGRVTDFPRFFDRIDWHTGTDGNDDADSSGFRVDLDWGALFEIRLADV